MFDTLKNLFTKEKTDYQQLVSEGALILDVRNKSEFAGGHIKGAVNIPVNILQDNLNKIKDKNRTVITCCASGMRSATAKSILKSNGFTNIHNGGGWQSLDIKLK